MSETGKWFADPAVRTAVLGLLLGTGGAGSGFLLGLLGLWLKRRSERAGSSLQTRQQEFSEDQADLKAWQDLYREEKARRVEAESEQRREKTSGERWRTIAEMWYALAHKQFHLANNRIMAAMSGQKPKALESLPAALEDIRPERLSGG